LPSHYLDVSPDLVFEVKSPSDRWSKMLTKIGEYLQAGVPVVCVLDPETETARLYFADEPEITLEASDELTFPNQLPGFRVPVRALFE
jgi:Uma2 family endonuclease